METARGRRAVIVREAVEGDIPYIAALIQEFVHSSGYKRHEVNIAHLVGVLRQIMSGQDGLLAVLERDNEFCGVYVGGAHRHLFSGEWLLSEACLCTTPAARGHGRKLLKYAEEWGKARGCRESSLSHHEDQNELTTLYRRWGYEPLEHAYMKELS